MHNKSVMQRKLNVTGVNKMTNQQIIEQMEIWIRQGRLSFNDLQTLASQAYAKEAAQDE
jgi:predicted double-glycine peptidase